MSRLDTPLFDSAALDELYELEDESNSTMVDDLIAEFQTYSQKLCLQMETSLAHSDVKGLETAAHTLKSSARMLGCLRLATLLADIESCGHANNLSECIPLVADLPTMLTASLQHLKGTKK